MGWLAYLVASVFTVAGAGCVVLLVLQAPGTWMLLGLALLVEWVDRFYLPELERQTFTVWVLWACLALALVGEAIEFAAGVVGAKVGGSSNRGMWGALVGGILGAILLTPFFLFVPVLGALLGALVGTFAGAVIGELSAVRRRPTSGDLVGTWRPALWATVGRVVGTTAKIGIGITMWLALAVDAFVR